MGRRILKGLLPVGFWLAVWTLCAGAVGKELLLPGPGAVFRTLSELILRAEFWHSIGASLGRVTAGFALGAFLGTALGALTAAFPWCDRILSPALRAVRTVPVVSFILLLFFWLPQSRVPVVVAGLMALPVVWRAARQGLAGADPRLVELTQAYGLSPWRKIRYLYVPSAMPALSAGWETALGLSWKSGVAAEVLCQPKWAMGTALQTAKSYLDAPGLFAWTITMVAVSLGTERILRLALRRWKGGDGG